MLCPHQPGENNSSSVIASGFVQSNICLQSIGKRLLLDQAASADDSKDYQGATSFQQDMCEEDDCKTKLFQLTAELTCARHKITYLENLLTASSQNDANKAASHDE